MQPVFARLTAGIDFRSVDDRITGDEFDMPLRNHWFMEDFHLGKDEISICSGGRENFALLEEFFFPPGHGGGGPPARRVREAPDKRKRRGIGRGVGV